MISIYKTKVEGKFVIYSDHEFFRNKHVLYSYRDGCLKIWLPDLNYQGKVRTTSYVSKGQNARQVVVVDRDLVPGKYEIDMEESTEDEVIAYLNEEK